jgi:hypothetical protein
MALTNEVLTSLMVHRFWIDSIQHLGGLIVYLWLTEWHIHPQVGGFEVLWLPLCIRVGDLVVGVIGDACVYILCLFLILIFDCDQSTSSSSTISQYLSRLPTQYPHPDLHLQPNIIGL